MAWSHVHLHARLGLSLCPSALLARLLVVVAVVAGLAAADGNSDNNTFNDASDKRGLVYVSTTTALTDVQPFVAPAAGLTWYYDYSPQPPSGLNAHTLEFVPMLWGADPDASFASTVRASQTKVSTVLAFNEPDACDGGGSCLSPSDAASLWLSQLEPLKADGIKLGSPAVVGAPSGIQWLGEWFAACYAQSPSGCNPDFLAVHWYGNLDGLSWWLNMTHTLYAANMTDGIWVTEFAYPLAQQDVTEDFFNQSTSLFNSLDYVKKYAYFGSFRTSSSNIGNNAPMLDSHGKMTRIGSWYVDGTTKVGDGADADAKGAAATSAGVRWTWLVGLVAAAAVGLS